MFEREIACTMRGFEELRECGGISAACKNVRTRPHLSSICRESARMLYARGAADSASACSRARGGNNSYLHHISPRGVLGVGRR